MGNLATAYNANDCFAYFRQRFDQQFCAILSTSLRLCCIHCMTFSVDRPLDFSEIPCFVEGSSEEITQRLLELAKCVSNQVHVLDSERRKTLHLAAVFACNFVNHLYDVASSLLETKNLSPQWLLPLISETAKKVADLSPHDAQTGPARRGDRRVMEAHLMQLRKPQRVEKIVRSTE